MESLELFGREVLPEFKDRDEKLRAAKASRLERYVDAALERREAALSDLPKLPEGYVMDAMIKAVVKQVGGEETLEKIASRTAVGEKISDVIGEEVTEEIS